MEDQHINVLKMLAILLIIAITLGGIVWQIFSSEQKSENRRREEEEI